MAAADWVRMRLPPDVRMGAKHIAERCRWRAKHETEDVWSVCSEDRYRGGPPDLLRLQHVANAADADDANRYTQFSRWHEQGEVMDAYRPQFDADRRKLAAIGTDTAGWRWLRTIILGASDAQLGEYVRIAYSRVAQGMPASSLWAMTEDPAVEWRQSMIRVQFTMDVIPEFATRAALVGTRASRGLTSPGKFGHALLVESLLLMCAPWLLGFVAGRRGGSVIFLFGSPLAGRDPDIAPELIDSYRPNLLAPAIRRPQSPPSLEAATVSDALTWWVRQLDRLLGVALDPTVFTAADGGYDARRHFGMVLTLDRLFVALNTLLVGSRREEFTRRLLMFEILDILAGLGVGGYDPYLRPERAREMLERLEQELPASVAAIVLPRCREAVDKLVSALDGFYLTERLNPGPPVTLTVPTKAGPDQELGLGRALALYINLVRDAGHSFEQKVRSPGDLALMASHTGELPPEISDIAVLFFVDLIANPENFRRALRTRAPAAH